MQTFKIKQEAQVSTTLKTGSGNLSMFAGLAGTVQAVKGFVTEDGKRVWIGEIGVKLPGASSLVWFRADELV